MMKLAKLIFVIIGVLLCANAVNGLSASIGNARAIIRVDLNEVPTIINRTILINNVNEIPVSIDVKAGNEIKDIIEIEDKNLELQPDGSAKARFKIILKKPGRYSGKIMISFYPNDTSVKAQPVGMAANLIIIANAVDGVDYPDYTPAINVNKNTTINTNTTLGDKTENSSVSINLGGGKPKVNTTSNIHSTDNSSTNTKSSSPSVLIGIITVVVIVLLGGIIFFIMMKKGAF